MAGAYRQLLRERLERLAEEQGKLGQSLRLMAAELKNMRAVAREISNRQERRNQYQIIKGKQAEYDAELEALQAINREIEDIIAELGSR